ncbi:MAG: apolipoprotein N-acyltransferase [Terriglobia bacterium]
MISIAWKPLEKLSVRYGAAVLSGVFLFAAFPRLDWNRLVWIAAMPLLAALASERRAHHGFFLAYVAGAIFLTGSCYWFVYVMEIHGGLSPLLSIGVLLLFVIVFSVFFGAFGLAVTCVARSSPANALLLSPFLWVTMELARTYLITGFPWNLLGYAVQVNGLQRLASYTAVYGLSFLAAVTSALFAWLFLNPRGRGARIAMASWIVFLIAANWVVAPPALSPGPAEAIIVQPNVPLDSAVLEHWAPWRDPTQLERLVGITEAAREKLGSTASASPPLLIWSENPAPFYFDRDTVFRQAMENMARQTGSYVVVGTMTSKAEDGGRPRNSAIVLDPEGRELLQYDKIHLVPFGEYVPEWAFPGKIGKITLEVGDFVAGTKYQVARTPQGAIGIFICYEAIFPQLVRRLAAQGATVLVTISDDMWFGDSSAPFQHLEMARFRAIENGRYLLRSTNDGVTAVIDPYGRVVATLPRHQQLALPAHFTYLAEQTFYTAHGDVFAWLCVILSVLIIVLWKMKVIRTNYE